MLQMFMMQNQQQGQNRQLEKRAQMNALDKKKEKMKEELAN